MTKRAMTRWMTRWSSWVMGLKMRMSWSRQDNMNCRQVGKDPKPWRKDHRWQAPRLDYKSLEEQTERVLMEVRIERPGDRIGVQEERPLASSSWAWLLTKGKKRYYYTTLLFFW